MLSQRIGQVPPPWIIIIGGCADYTFPFCSTEGRQKTQKLLLVGSFLFAERLCPTLNQKDLGFWRPNTLCGISVWFSPTGLTGSGLSYTHRTQDKSCRHVYMSRLYGGSTGQFKKQEHTACWLMKNCSAHSALLIPLVIKTMFLDMMPTNLNDNFVNTAQSLYSLTH